MASLAMIALTSNLWDRKMLSDIFIGAENVRRVIITVLVLMCIWSVYCIHRLETDVIDLQTKLTEQEKKTKDIKEDIEKLQAYCEELEAANDIDKAEFVNIWESLATVRNNFLALGHGLHLAREDICPESEPECNHQKLEEEM